MSEQAVVRFRTQLGRTQAFLLENISAPHFVYEFLSILENVYECPVDEIPVRFGQLVGNFLGKRGGIYPWPTGDDFTEDLGMYDVRVDKCPWSITRSISPQSKLRWPSTSREMEDKDVQAERAKALEHPLIVSGELRREIRNKNDQHFMAIRSVPTTGEPAR